MSPEYALDGFFSIKSDVFSFGVIVLEIISGKRNTGFYNSEQDLSLLDYVSIFTNEYNVVVDHATFPLNFSGIISTFNGCRYGDCGRKT